MGKYGLKLISRNGLIFSFQELVFFDVFFLCFDDYELLEIVDGCFLVVNGCPCLGAFHLVLNCEVGNVV